MNPIGGLFISLSIMQSGLFGQVNGFIGILLAIACIFANRRNGSFKKWYYFIEVLIILFIVIGLAVVLSNINTLTRFISNMGENPAYGSIPVIGLIIYFAKYKSLRQKEKADDKE